jgi:uroporphyrinogen decarboxylase
MRQAGRYLPEYRHLRERAGGFLELCLTPALALEATLQPVRRFAMDAAILFSDILMVPYGLGQSVEFVESHGPVLDALNGTEDLARLSLAALPERLAPVYQAIRELAGALAPETALIGFAGAPWTLASYMIEGGSSRDFLKAKAWAYGDRQGFSQLMNLLAEAVLAHLDAQIRAGAEIVQIFDSWAGALSGEMIETWSLAPIEAIVARLRARHPDVPIIVFPRGAGAAYKSFAENLRGCALGLDTSVPLSFAREELQPLVVVQGNLDPVLLVSGGAPMDAAVERILERLGPQRLVFNLGHGVLPQTPPEHVARLSERLRAKGSGPP